MTVQQSKRRPLSRYLKDFKHSQTHCAHCKKLLDRITLVRRGEIVNKIAISRLDTLMDEAAWLEEQKEWVALCRFCGDLHCKEQSDFFDIIGFKQFLFEGDEPRNRTRICRPPAPSRTTSHREQHLPRSAEDRLSG